VSQDLIRRNVAIVHGVALSQAMLREVADRHAKIVWSPRSNLSLYGATLDVRAALADGIVVALGTDWLPTGSFSMAREAACARAYAQATGAPLSARTLWMMMTLNGAKAAGMEQVLGAIRPGLAADLILVARRGEDPYEAVVSAAPGDLMLVLRGGRLLVGDADLTARARLSDATCEPLDIAGAAKTLCVAREGGKNYKALAAVMVDRGAGPAVFSGVPTIEPRCEPSGSPGRGSDPSSWPPSR
jgi:cytosine/adenosine deaminase-related metal-dependent hydrolase